MRFIVCFTFAFALAVGALAQETPATLAVPAQQTLRLGKLHSAGIGTNSAGDFAYYVKPGTDFRPLLPRVYGGLSVLEAGSGPYFGMEAHDLFVRPGLLYLTVVPHQRLATFTKTGAAVITDEWIKTTTPPAEGPAQETQVVMQQRILRDPEAATTFTYPTEMVYAYIGNGPGELLQHAGIGFVRGSQPDIANGVAYDLQRNAKSPNSAVDVHLTGPEIGASFSTHREPYWYLSWVTVVAK